MSWFNRSPKKVPLPPSGVMVDHYPKTGYSAYFEKMHETNHHGDHAPGLAVVRFYDRKSGRLLSYSQFEHPDYNKREEMMDSHIVNQMKSYKV